MIHSSEARSELNAIIQASKVPGIQYLVIRASGEVFEYSGGSADIAARRPMSSSTTMMAYSMSKTITAAAVLQLVDIGQLRPDDSIERYASTPYGPNVTIRHLLAHTSGIPNPIPLAWIHSSDLHATFEENEALTAVMRRYHRLSFAPGTKYAYSNIGYWLLGKIVERVSGIGFTSYVQNQILDRLSIESGELSYTIEGDNHARGYLEKYSALNLIKRLVVKPEFIGKYEGRWLQIKDHYLNGPAFGGLVGTGRGFGKFLQDQLSPHSKLFADSTRSLLYTAEKASKGPIPMTLGWHIGSTNGTTFYYKEGGGGGFHCMMRLYPAAGVAAVVMTNATTFDVARLLSKLRPELIGSVCS